MIGTGSISTAHIEAYKKLKNVEVLAACSTSRERAERFAEKYQIPYAFTDYHEMLKINEIDAVSVTTWNNVHAPASVAALKAGKHVLCEKPSALNALEDRQMAEVAEKSGKLLMMGLSRRFSAKTIALKQFIDAGALGKVYYAKTGYIRRWGNPGGWFSIKERSGGGPVIDLGVHMIDLVWFLTGKPKVVSVSASTFNYLGMKPDIKGLSKYCSANYSDEHDVEDGAAAIIRFAGGLTLLLETSWVQHIKEDSLYLELYGDKAGAKLEPEIELYESRQNYLVNVRPVIEESFNDFQHMFDEEIEHFIHCITDNIPCLSPAHDGVELMKIIDAIYESARLGHEVMVDLTE